MYMYFCLSTPFSTFLLSFPPLWPTLLPLHSPTLHHQICGVDQQEKGHYPSHMFVVMVIHFLQQRGVLPVLHQVSEVTAYCVHV